MKNNFKGITLIALVITLIVLLILAGVSIAMLTGQNGILNQAQNAGERTTQSNAEEMVTVAIGGLQSENLGDTSKITPQIIASKVNEENNRSDVTAEGTSFPTNIVFNDDGIKVPVDINLKVGSASDEEEEDLPIYSVDVDESKIASQEIFNIETSDGKVASTNDVQTIGTAKINGIKPEYCNNYEGQANDTFYKIEYDQPGVDLNDTLIVPYKVEVDGNWYLVTEVSLEVEYKRYYTGKSAFPDVDNIIYPNTVTKIIVTDKGSPYNNETEVGGGPTTVILPEKITEIPANMFNGAKNLSNIKIPKSTTKIGIQAFAFCSSLENIEISENVTDIDGNVFQGSTKLKNINVDPNNPNYSSVNGVLFNKDKTSLIAYPAAKTETEYTVPDTVKTIKEYAFYDVSNLETLNIPENVDKIEKSAFSASSSTSGGIKTINISKPAGTIIGEPWGAEKDSINWLG